MIKLLSTNKKWKDYINYKEDENKIALIMAVAICVILNICKFYECFNQYSDLIENILLGIATGALSIIGLALSGVSIIIGLFSRKQIMLIEKHNGEGSFEKIMSSFLFLAFNCANMLIICIVLLIVLKSNLVLARKSILYLITFFLVYFIVYNVFYAVSLVGNCIRIFKIRNIYDVITEKEFMDEANEIRIDLIYSTLLNKYNISQDEFMAELENAVKDSNVKSKKELIDYYYKYYTGQSKQ